MQLSNLIIKLTEQQDVEKKVSMMQGVLDLLSDEERDELAKFIQTNIQNATPEQKRQEKLAAAAAAAQSVMTPVTRKIQKPKKYQSPSELRAAKLDTASRAAQVGMEPGGRSFSAMSGQLKDIDKSGERAFGNISNQLRGAKISTTAGDPGATAFKSITGQLKPSKKRVSKKRNT